MLGTGGVVGPLRVVGDANGGGCSPGYEAINDGVGCSCGQWARWGGFEPSETELMLLHDEITACCTDNFHPRFES